MHNKITVSIIITLLVSFLWVFTAVNINAKTPDPSEQLRPFIDQIVNILTDEKLKGEENCFERRRRVMDVAQQRFDFYEMSKRVLGSQWRKLSEQEKKNFADLFTTLLEHAYIGKIEDYSDQKVEFQDQRIRNDRAEVQTTIIDQDVTIPVSYIMILKRGEWMVYDIVVEGVSLIRNYMEQFKEILRKDGYPSLLQQLKDKVNELEKTTKPCPVDLPDKDA